MTGAAAMAFAEQSARDELFWNLMGHFERYALSQYRTWLGELPLSTKEACLRDLETLVPRGLPLPAGGLERSMTAVLEASRALEGRATILVAQGLVLEQVRRSIYVSVAKSPLAGFRTRELGRAASVASAEVARRCAALFAREVESEARFSCFVAASHESLKRLDGLGEEIDAAFGDGYGLRFSHIVGDFVAELLLSCTSLGMERRKVLGHLSSALLGF